MIALQNIESAAPIFAGVSDTSRHGSLIQCNIVACLSEFPSPFRLDDSQLLNHLSLDPSGFDETQYFEIVTYLAYLHAVERPLKRGPDIVKRLLKLLKQVGVEHAGVSHTALDILACPLFDVTDRRRVLRQLTASLNAPKAFIRTNTNADAVLQKLLQHPWFTPWSSSIPLLRQIERRLASRSY